MAASLLRKIRSALLKMHTDFTQHFKFYKKIAFLEKRLIRLFLKAYRLSEMNFIFLFKVANFRCFILIAVEIFHNIIRK